MWLLLGWACARSTSENPDPTPLTPRCEATFGDHCSCEPQCKTPEESEQETGWCAAYCGEEDWDCAWDGARCVIRPR